MESRAIGITYTPNRKEHRLVFFDGELGVPGQGVPLLKKDLLTTLRKSSKSSFLPLGAREDTTADDIVISRPILCLLHGKISEFL